MACMSPPLLHKHELNKNVYIKKDTAALAIHFVKLESRPRPGSELTDTGLTPLGRYRGHCESLATLFHPLTHSLPYPKGIPSQTPY